MFVNGNARLFIRACEERSGYMYVVSSYEPLVLCPHMSP